MIDSISLPDVAYLSATGISSSPPRRYAGTTFESLMAKTKYPAAMGRVAEYADSLAAESRSPILPQNDLLLSGEEGSGVTSTLLALVDRVGRSGKGVLYVTAGDLFSIMSEEGASRIGDVLAVLDAYPYVAIDDVGEPVLGIEPGFAQAALGRIIDGRYVQCMRTFIGTAIPIGALATRGFGVNKRIIGRLSGERITLRSEGTGEGVRA